MEEPYEDYYEGQIEEPHGEQTEEPYEGQLDTALERLGHSGKTFLAATGTTVLCIVAQRAGLPVAERLLVDVAGCGSSLLAITSGFHMIGDAVSLVSDRLKQAAGGVRARPVLAPMDEPETLVSPDESWPMPSPVEELYFDPTRGYQTRPADSVDL